MSFIDIRIKDYYAEDDSVVSLFALAESNKQKQYKNILHRREIKKIKDPVIAVWQ